MPCSELQKECDHLQRAEERHPIALLVPVLIIGAPFQFDARLFNCAVIVYRGRLLGLVPKTYLPNCREFYEKRQFTSARDAVSREVLVFGEEVPFGNDLIFDAVNVQGFKLPVEICEDVWTPILPARMLHWPEQRS